MTFADLLWLPPLLIGISVVLGASGNRTDAEIPRAIRTRFVQLFILMVCVALAARSLVLLFT